MRIRDLTTTSRNTWRSLLANSRIPSGTTISQLLELFLGMLLPSLAGTSVPAFRLRACAVELVLHGRTTAGCLHGDSCVGTPRVLGELLAIIVLFRNFLFSGLQK